jgi:hypothetical protein
MIVKMPVTYNKAPFLQWHGDSTERDYDQKNTCSGEVIGRHRKGGSGNRRHWCLYPHTTKIGYVSSGGNGVQGNPCTLAGANSSAWIGGGVNNHGNLNDYSGKSTNFSNTQAALKCTFNSVTGTKLVELSRDSKVSSVNGSGAIETNGGFKSQWDQLVFGITTEAGNNTGFCENVNNINTQVHSNGNKCYDELTNAAIKKSRGISYCETNPTQNVCACINISKGVRHCLANPTHPGCDTLVAEYNKFPGNAQTEFDTKNFSPKCFAPDICNGTGQYQPMSAADACKQTIAVCQQDLNLYGNIANQAIINIDQSMDCQAKSGSPSSAGAGGGGGGGGAGGGGGGGGAGEEASLTDFTSDPKVYIPKSLDDIKNDPKKKLGAMGIGGIALMCMCMILLLVVVGSGGGGDKSGPVKRRFR